MVKTIIQTENMDFTYPDSTIIDFNIDTTLYNTKYSYWNYVPLMDSPGPLVAGDINKNEYPSTRRGGRQSLQNAEQNLFILKPAVKLTCTRTAMDILFSALRISHPAPRLLRAANIVFAVKKEYPSLCLVNQRFILRIKNCLNIFIFY